MSVRRNVPSPTSLRPEAETIARDALVESRLRGLPAAEEYRVIADRLYRHGYRDLPPYALVEWIESTVAADYEYFLRLRSSGERLLSAIARGDYAQAIWHLASDLDRDSRSRLIDGLRRLNDLDNNVG